MTLAADRRKLASQLLRAQALLRSTGDLLTKLRLRKFIVDVEKRLAALDAELVGSVTPAAEAADRR